jgi:glycosyltransferase involved in cell wall biosynthesis
LKNSLRTLTSQTYHDVEIILIDDGSPTDEIERLAKELGVVYNRLRGPGAKPRIPNKAWLQGYDICRGDFIVLTYAEILVPRNAVERMLERHEELSRDGDPRYSGYDYAKLGARLIPIQFCLSPEIQEKIDYWFDPENVDQFQAIPGFWKYINHWGWTNEGAHGWRHHCAFTGAPRHFWDSIGVVEDSDLWFWDIENGVTAAQRKAGVRAEAVEYGVYHQFHPWERPGDPPETWRTQSPAKKTRKEQAQPVSGPISQKAPTPVRKTRKEQVRPTPGPTINVESEKPELMEKSVRVRRIEGQ